MIALLYPVMFLEQPRNKESHLQKVKDLFNRLGAEKSGSITYLMFEEKINSPEVREYFQSLGLEASLQVALHFGDDLVPADSTHQKQCTCISIQ